MSDQDGERARRRAELWRETSLAHGAVHYLGLRSYVVSLSNLPDAFKLADRFVRCIDERTPGGVHLAASGLLLGEERAKRFAEAAQAEGITYHDDCGAARVWAERCGHPEAEAYARAREFAERLAADLGLPCREAPLSGSAGLHGAVTVYYDGTGRLDPSRASGLPRGFVVSRRHLDFEPACALEEVRLAVRIALGELGLADLFTAEEPLRLAPVGDPWDERFSLDRLTEELQTLDLPEAGRVVIDGFEAPSR